MQCAWCNRLLSKTHGYSENQEPICAVYGTKEYNACKARKHRLEAKRARTSDIGEKREIEASGVAVGHLMEGIQVMISQLDELISLQRQQLAQPKQVVTETKVISTTTFEAPTFEDDLMADIEITKTKDVSSADRFRKQMMAMANKEGVWADKPKDVQ